MSDIVSALDGPILRITLNCPDRGTKASDEMDAELAGLISGAPASANIVVLRGAGSDFCLGRARMGARATVEPESLQRRDTTDVVFGLYRAIRSSDVPVVCGVQGGAIGFGCALAAICDITLAAADSRFSTPEMDHAVLPTVVMSSFVDRVPRKALNYLIYSSAEIGAERALTFGIVSDVVPEGSLDAAVDDLCAAMLKAPSIALRGAKEYMKTAPDMGIEGAVSYARNLHAVINSSKRMREQREP
jgi:enoyl-CoA hydratase